MWYESVLNEGVLNEGVLNILQSSKIIASPFDAVLFYTRILYKFVQTNDCCF